MALPSAWRLSLALLLALQVFAEEIAVQDVVSQEAAVRKERSYPDYPPPDPPAYPPPDPPAYPPPAYPPPAYPPADPPYSPPAPPDSKPSYRTYFLADKHDSPYDYYKPPGGPYGGGDGYGFGYGAGHGGGYPDGHDGKHDLLPLHPLHIGLCLHKADGVKGVPLKPPHLPPHGYNY